MSDKLNQAIATIKSGDKQTGKQLLIEILKTEPHNENAWLWMTQVVSKKDEKIKCLERVLKINPGNEIARRGIARLRPVESPSLDDIARETKAPVVQRKKRERTESAIRHLEKVGKPSITSGPNDQQLIQQYIAKRTRQGWQVVNQTDTSVQMRKSKRWSTALLVLGGVLLIFFGIGLIFWILAVIDYAIKKEQTVYVTADELRRGTEKKPASSMKGPLIVAGVLIGGFILCIAFSLLPALLITPTSSTSSSSNQVATSNSKPAPTSTPQPTPTPLKGIKAPRQKLVNHFEYRYSFTDWQQRTYDDGTIQIVGTSPDERLKIVMWSTPDDPEDLVELFFSFRFPYENGDEVRKRGIEGMFDTMQIVLPDWDEGADWLVNSIESDKEEVIKRVNDVDVYLEQGDEAGKEYIVIFSVVE